MSLWQIFCMAHAWNDYNINRTTKCILGHVGQHCPGFGGKGLRQSGAGHGTRRQSSVGGSVGAEHRGQHSPEWTIGLAPSTQIGKMAGQKQRGGYTALAAKRHKDNFELIAAYNH